MVLKFYYVYNYLYLMEEFNMSKKMNINKRNKSTQNYLRYLMYLCSMSIPLQII